MCCFGKLWHGGDIAIGAHHVVQETRRKDGLTLQFRPIQYAVVYREFGEVDTAQAAVFEWSKVLLSALMCNDTVRNHAMRLHLCQIVNVSSTRISYLSNVRPKPFKARPT